MDFKKRYWVVTDSGLVVSTWDVYQQALADLRAAKKQQPPIKYELVIYRVDKVHPR
jgi:hypothetical protein